MLVLSTVSDPATAATGRRKRRGRAAHQAAAEITETPAVWPGVEGGCYRPLSDAEERDVQERQERADPEIIVSALPHLKFPGWIKEFASAADPVTRTFSVKLNFKNPGDMNILPGMTARVQVTVNPERAWSVPVSAAVASDAGDPFVWKVDPETLEVSRAQVALGDLVNDRVRITDGLEEGDMVAISGVNQLRDGMVVRLLDQ